MVTTFKKIAVIGAGPVGGVLAAYLINSGYDVTIIDTDQTLVKTANDSGLRVFGANREGINVLAGQSFKAFSSLSNLAEDTDVIFVCVKTVALNSIISALKKLNLSNNVCVSMQNGIDPEEELSEIFGEKNNFRVVVNYAGRMVEPCNYQLHWFASPNYIGALIDTAESNQIAKKLAELLSLIGLETKVVADIKSYAFEKTALTAALNTVSALTNLTIGQAMKFYSTKELVMNILKETREVGEKSGFVFKKSLAEWVEYLEKGGVHRTSMWEDVRVKRKTEVEWFNGKICQYGERIGVPTPYNRTMEQIILGLEESFLCQMK